MKPFHLALMLGLSLSACDCGGDDGPTDGALPDGALPDGARPDGARPDGALPDGALPDGALPDGALPDGAVPDTSGGCGMLGDVCATAAGCCTGNCVAAGGEACGVGGDCRCAPRVGCTAAGVACADDSECCNNLCDRPDGAAMGTCATPGSCRTAGEPCSGEGLSGSCCSTVCLDTDGTGPRCQFLGGCRVQDDLCRTDGECCSGECSESGTTADGRPIMRCANAGSCLPAGEVCGEGGASSNCCPNGGGDTGCEPTGTGFRRCFGGSADCTIPSRPCVDTAECCADAFPGIQCLPDRTGTNACCLPEGESCAFGDVCCGGICVPDAVDGTLRCAAMCVPDGGACATAADCCGCGCVSDGMGGNVCTSDAAECGACMGPQLGELCDPVAAPCCNGPAVVCPTGVEFPTCMRAP